jgi:hypothetical protein
MPCDSRVRVWYDDKKHPVRYELICDGKCKAGDAKDCVPHKAAEATIQETVTTEYCCCNGCDGGETTGCHIVIRTVKKPDKDPVIKMRCKGNACAADEKCAPVPVYQGEVPMPDADGDFTGKMGLWIEFRCECKPKRETWGHWV